MAIATPTIDQQVPTVGQRSVLSSFWLRFRRNKLAVAAFIFIVLQIVMAVFAFQIAPYNPLKGDYAAVWQAPNAKYLLGTDDLGRDVLSRLIYGAQVSLAVGILSQVLIVLIGLPIGAIAGLLGGWVDFTIMRIIDILSALPTMLFYILLLVVLGSGFTNIILAMAITGWIGIARLVRGQVLSLKESDYVRAARSMGGNSRHIIVTHLIRNSFTPVIVSMALGIPGAMFAEAGLSFLGLGIAPPAASWGQMIGLYQAYIQTFWWVTVFPALALAVTMLAWSFLGDGVRDALDPSVRA
jgi:ABC-type dipeptide/oligopeptide/nickel transport system permease subunit